MIFFAFPTLKLIHRQAYLIALLVNQSEVSRLLGDEICFVKVSSLMISQLLAYVSDSHTTEERANRSTVSL